MELSKVNDVALDFLNGEINQHTSNLGSLIFTGNLLNILVDEFSDLSLVVRVVGNDGR